MTELTLTHGLPRPIFYSFRRCPYAMRARLAVAVAGAVVELREVELGNKPEAMLAVSPKGTVPVLLCESGTVIDESLDIMYWALHQNDPGFWLEQRRQQQAEALIRRNDEEFKYHLGRYKYADCYPEYSAHHYRQQGESFLADLEKRLTQIPYLCGDHFSLADAAILPFIRQFAAVDTVWFENSPYPAVKQWLNRFLSSQLFNAVMTKYSPWKPGDAELFFPIETIAGCGRF